MSVQPITVGGRAGTVVYLDDAWQVVPAAQATLARVLFADGGSAFYRVEPVSTRARWIAEHAQREYDESQHPRDDDGKWTDSGGGGGGGSKTGSGDAPSGTSPAAAEHGVAAMSRLLDTAVDQADFSGLENPEAGSYDDLSADAKEAVLQEFFENVGDDIEIDTEYLDKEFADNLRENNEEIIKAAEADTLAALADDPGFKDTEPTLPGDFHPVIKLDPETLVYDTDTGDGAPLDLAALRTTIGHELTDAQQQAVNTAWNDAYQTHFDKAFEKRYDDSHYQDQESELRNDAENEAWNNLSDKAKFKIAVDLGKTEGVGMEVDPGLPTHWVTGIRENETNDTEDYARTRAIARSLTDLRTNEILEARGQKATWSNANSAEVWSSWKSSSTSADALALQLATAEELGGVDRLTPAQRASAREAADGYGGMDALHAYARAQWETTQFIMKQAGEDHAEVYRGILLPKQDLENVAKEAFDRTGNPIPPAMAAGGISYKPRADYTKLPDVSLLRNGLQSTTGTESVANNWNGTGESPANAQRVVLRIAAPRHSVFSLPVYGQNIQNEHEVVLAGLKDPWSWDLWEHRAPTFDTVPLTKHAAARATAKRKQIVIDLREPPGTPHWLSKTDPALAKWQAKRRAAGVRPTPKQKGTK